MNSRNHRGWIWTLAAAAALLMSVATRSEALMFTFSGVGAGGRSASVTFSQASTGGNLVVTLTNTSSANVTDPSQVLTAVFFSINQPGSGQLTPSSALLDGSTVVQGSSYSGNIPVFIAKRPIRTVRSLLHLQPVGQTERICK